ncbi:hypothetical protein D3C86_1288570 [compost metagenome]
MPKICISEKMREPKITGTLMSIAGLFSILVTACGTGNELLTSGGITKNEAEARAIELFGGIVVPKTSLKSWEEIESNTKLVNLKSNTFVYDKNLPAFVVNLQGTKNSPFKFSEIPIGKGIVIVPTDGNRPFGSIDGEK